MASGLVPGYCGETSGAGDCNSSNVGSWKLTSQQSTDWSAAARACTTRCERCARCRYVSFSLRWRDCSWFSDCTLGRLQHSVGGGFLSTEVLPRSRQDALPARPTPFDSSTTSRPIPARSVTREGSSASLVVYCVYFGAPPPWFPLTLLSMQYNARVQFVVVGDHVASAARDRGVGNIRGVTLTFSEYRRRLEQLTNLSLTWDSSCSGLSCGKATTNKLCDTRPFLGALFGEITRAHAFWAWMDADVITGQLLEHMELHSWPDIVCPVHPNRHRLLSWGPFTAFRSDFAIAPYELSDSWQGALSSGTYQLFDEIGRNAWFEGLSDALNRAHAVTPLRTNRRLRIGEATACTPEAASIACGASSAKLQPTQLTVNGKPVMLLHLGHSKRAWGASPPQLSALASNASARCVAIDNLLGLQERANDALRHAAASENSTLLRRMLAVHGSMASKGVTSHAKRMSKRLEARERDQLGDQQQRQSAAAGLKDARSARASHATKHTPRRSPRTHGRATGTGVTTRDADASLHVRVC